MCACAGANYWVDSHDTSGFAFPPFLVSELVLDRVVRQTTLSESMRCQVSKHVIVES
jgi:hypothetical protein